MLKIYLYFKVSIENFRCLFNKTINKGVRQNFVTDANIDDEIDSLLFLITKGRASTIKELTHEELLEFSVYLQDDIKLVKTNIMELKDLYEEILSH